MTTLRRERIQKFKEILGKSKLYLLVLQYYDGNENTESMIDVIAESLADASISRSEIAGEYKTDEQKEAEAKIYNAPVFRGDWRDYPEHLHKIAECLRDVWMFDLPDKPKKRTSKSNYSFWIMSMDELKQACAEFGVTALVKAHEKWRAGFKNGIAPFTVATPQSLIKYTASIVLEMRQSGNSNLTETKIQSSRNLND